MSATNATYARIVRRETHSSRSAPAIALAILWILVIAWLGTEIVLAILTLPALLASPASLASFAAGLVDKPAGLVAAAGIAAAAIGLVLIIVALSPGRRARHVLDTERTATVVDNEVVASALARHACHAAMVDPDNVIVTVSHRRAVVRLVPTSGMSVDPGHVTDAVTEQLASYGLRPTVLARVRIAERAKVGA